MPFNTEMHGSEAILHLEGRLTHAAHPALRGAVFPLLDQAEVSTLCLDLAAVQYLDSSTLGLLLLLRERADARGKHVHLRDANASVRSILRVVQIDDLFRLEEQDPSRA